MSRLTLAEQFGDPGIKYRLLEDDVVRPTHKFRKRGDQRIKAIIIHTAECPWDRGHRWLSDWGAKTTKSAAWHAQVAADGTSFQLPDDYQAYHAIGVSGVSLGVEQVCYAKDWGKPATDWRDAMLKNLFNLVGDWVHKYKIPVIRPHVQDFVMRKVGGRLVRIADKNTLLPGIYAHSDVDPDRKSDPGVGFPWDDFFTGLGDKVMARHEAEVREVWKDPDPKTGWKGFKTEPTGDVPPVGNEMWLEMFQNEMKSINARPSSLRHVLEFYRLLSKEMDKDGADAAGVVSELLKRINSG